MAKLIYVVLDHLPEPYFDQIKGTTKGQLLEELSDLHQSLLPLSFNSQHQPSQHDPANDEPTSSTTHKYDLRLLSTMFALDNSLSKKSIRLASESAQKSLVLLMKNQWQMYQRLQAPIDKHLVHQIEGAIYETKANMVYLGHQVESAGAVGTAL